MSCVPMVPQPPFPWQVTGTDIWGLHKRSQANMSPANSAMAMISISMAGEVQSPSTSAKILGDWFKWYFQRYFNDVQWEVRRDGFYQLLFWVESRQFPAQTMQWTATSILLRRMVGVPSRFSCILKVKHSQNAVFGCCSVDQKVSRHHIRETAVEGSFVKIRKANLSLNKTCLLDNTSYFDWYCVYIYIYDISDVIISDLSGLQNWKLSMVTFHSAKFLRKCLRQGIINSASASVTFCASKSHVKIC